MSQFSNKLRILMLDDDPYLCDGNGFPSFSNEGNPVVRKALAENFEIEWLHDEISANVYYQSMKHARNSHRRTPSESIAIPNIIYFDYNLDQAEHIDAEIRHNDKMKERYDSLSPNIGDGSVAKYAEPWLNDERILKGRYIEFGTRSGCQIGAIISELLSDVPCVGIPKTINPDSYETAALEWLLNIPTKGAFDDKGVKKLDGWLAFLSKALPRLRDHMLNLCRSGNVTIIFPETLQKKDENVDCKSGSFFVVDHFGGRSEIRIQALFFDVLFDEKNGGQDKFSIELNQFWDKALKSMVSHGSNVIGSAFRSSLEYISAFESANFEVRKTISREVFEAWVLNEQQLSEPAANVLQEWKIDERKARSDFDGKTRELSHRINKEYLPEYLPSLGGVGGGNDLIGRYTALSLMVYAEKIRASLTDTKKINAAKKVVAVLDGELLDNTLLTELEAVQGVWLNEQEIIEIQQQIGKLDDPGEILLRLREVLGPIYSSMKSAIGLSYSLKQKLDGCDDLSSVKESRTVEEAVEIFYDLAAANPLNILLWRESKNQRSEILRPLERLGDGKLGIRPSVIFGNLLSDPFGLKIGEGRLLALFAVAHGFDKKYWPAWMRDGESY